MRLRRHAAVLFFVGTLFLLPVPGNPRAQEAGESKTRLVALELVLAVDCSSSVDDLEFALQMQGYAEAFQDPDVTEAILSLGEKGLAVSLFQWSGSRMHLVSQPWTLLRTAEEIERFGIDLAASPRLLSGSTGLGGAIRYGLAEVEGNRFQGLRQVIDISGDGYAGISPDLERDRALARGVTINGLAITNEVPELGAYYAGHVIGGPGAFVITASDYQDFTAAIKRKLLRELAPPEMASREFQGADKRTRQGSNAAQLYAGNVTTVD
jgi:hypothetical protein